MKRDSKPFGAITETLKKDLKCWENPEGGQPVLNEYQAGDPVPAHLRQDQRDRLREQGVI